MKLRKGLIILFVSSSVWAYPAECREKIKWRKLKTEIEVNATILGCLPLQSSRMDFRRFLERQKKVIYSDANERIVYVSAKTKSKSLWIEKQWLMEFMFDENDRLIELKVKEGLTGL